jgi:acetylornithine/succinyldiaminopimelate/putrescine aminotransferase
MASAGDVLERLRERRVLVSIVRDSVIRLAPPLNIPADVLEEGLGVVVDVLRRTSERGG